MNSNRLPAILIGLAVLLVLIYSSVFVVNEREQAIVVRFGEIQDVKRAPGIYFKLPFAFMDADRVQYVEDRALRFDLDNIRVQVRGGAFYEVDAFVVYSITDPRLFRETVSGDRDSAESRLRTRLDAALRRVYGLRNFDAALSNERSSMMQEVRTDLTAAAETLGLAIRDVRIRRTDLTQEVSQQTFQRMKAERLAEAELIRARGNEQGQRRRAIADRQVVEFVSEAQRDAEILRGQGDAERNKIFGEAFQRDPAFFEFYRTMRAYVAALADNGTTLVLSPDSEFFRFFNSSAGQALAPIQTPVPRAPPAAPAAPAN
ncbi:band 7 protein [Rhizobium sp. CF080]|uniref:protease modulator HflC n=1 Tax=Rhizobium sp. (strain CF080) TaxID=1144310 RepID=UPI0002717755|nr:protease modulator HflC [Rhizobium sp. CF080]EUB96187.1 band 7 protein [Rhizobium sp. CF080]